jgi:SAM-dependent MidA family methyltransferase
VTNLGLGHNGGVATGCGVSELEEIIRREISQRGFIAFSRYMELALYHPTLGYYRRRGERFGIRGDFYTAAQLVPFSDLMAMFTSTLAHLSRCTRAFSVLELGAGRQDLRTALAPWSYRGFDWTADALPDRMSGLVIANEFFDALPVDLLRRTPRGWREVVVALKDGQLIARDGGQPSRAAHAYAERYGALIPPRGILEVNPGLDSWLRRVSQLLECGWFMIIDYGYSARELARFPDGTLMSYRQHHAAPTILARPGEYDITTHVNFSELRRIAVQCGFEVIREATLADWALSVWDEHQLRERWEESDARWRLEWKQLVFGMGETFRIVMVEKNRPQK